MCLVRGVESFVIAGHLGVVELGLQRVHLLLDGEEHALTTSGQVPM